MAGVADHSLVGVFFSRAFFGGALAPFCGDLGGLLLPIGQRVRVDGNNGGSHAVVPVEAGFEADGIVGQTKGLNENLAARQLVA